MKLIKAPIIAGCFGLAAFSQAFSTWNYSLVGETNAGAAGIHEAVCGSGSGAEIAVTGGASFTGMDRIGNSQTMSYIGTTRTSAQYGRLRSYTTLAVTNTYYNAANPVYINTDNTVNPAGSPGSLTSLGFAGFNDTLHFGGSLAPGYKARYVFFCEGTNTGLGCLADLAFQIDGYSAESFFSFGDGPNTHYWSTLSYDINGITPQEVHVQFSNQVVYNLFDLADGQSLTSTSDYSSTLTLDHIDIVDSNGNLVTGVTVNADSGTNYVVTPEPASMCALGLGLAGIAKRRRKQ